MDFRILGPLEVLDGAAAGRARRAASAAPCSRVLLLHANETLSTERLIDELWGESPPATALKTLQVHVSRLRKALARRGDVLVTRAGTATSWGSSPTSSTPTGSSGCSREGRGELAAERPERAPSALERGARAVARPAARRPRLRAVRAGARSRASRTCAWRRVEQLIEAKLALGRHAEVIGGARGARRRAPLPRAAARAADARPLPRRPPGGRAPGLPERAPPARRGARDRARRAPARAGARGAGAGPRARAGSCRSASRTPRARAGTRGAGRAADRRRHLPAHGHRALVGAVGGGPGRDGRRARVPRRADRPHRRRRTAGGS